MSSIRIAALCFIVAFAFVPRPIYAQGPPGASSSVAARLAALEARVAKLESGQVDEADLVGTYRAHIFAIDLSGNPAKVQTETGGGTITLNADHTASLTGILVIHCRLLQASPWFVQCDDPEIAEAVLGAWSVQDGSLLVQVNGEEALNGLVGAGGRVIISGGTADDTEMPPRTPEVYSNLVIAIRLPNP